MSVPIYVVIGAWKSVRSYSFFEGDSHASYRVRDGWLWRTSTLGEDGEPAYPGSTPEGPVLHQTGDRAEHDRQMWALAAVLEVMEA